MDTFEPFKLSSRLIPWSNISTLYLNAQQPIPELNGIGQKPLYATGCYLKKPHPWNPGINWSLTSKSSSVSNSNFTTSKPKQTLQLMI